MAEASYELLNIESLTHGLASAIPVTALPQEAGFCRKLLNYNFDDIPGVLNKRPGTTAIFPELDGKVKGATMFMSYGTAPVYVAAVGATIVATTGDEWVEIQPAGWASTATSCDFAAVGGMLVVSDGVNTPFRWDNFDDGAVELSDMPKFSYLTSSRQRIFGAGLEDDPLALHACDPGDPSLWDYTDQTYRAFFSYVGTDSRITAVTAAEDYIIIGKTDSLYALAGTSISDFIIYTIDGNIGVGSQWAINLIRDIAFFVSNEGEIYRLDVGSRPERISTPIKDITDQVDQSRIEGEARSAVYDKFNYIVTLPVGNHDYVTLVYDVINRRWREWDRHIKESMRSTSYPGFYYTYTEDVKQFYTFNDTLFNDSGEAIDAELETMEMHFGLPKHEKEIRTLWIGTWVLDTAYRLFVDVSIDGGPWFNLTPEGVLVKGNTGDYIQVMVHVGKQGRNIKFRIKNDIVDQQVSLLDIAVTYNTRELE